MSSMPKALSKIVHQALRDWHKVQLDDRPWRDFISLTQNTMGGGGSPQSVDSVTIKEWIWRGLQCLELKDSRSAELLRRRFLDGEPVRKVANRWNVSESLIWKLQPEALVALAQCLWQEEMEVVEQRRTRILERLEIAVPPRLFGVADEQAALLELLDTREPPWIVAVDGIGGIGKTALVDSVVRQVVSRPLYADVGWVSARRNVYTLGGGLQERAEQPALTFENLVDLILFQFGREQAIRLPHDGKLAEAKRFLHSTPHLIVVDNLETAADYRAIVTDLFDLCAPTRFLLTSRHSLRAFSGVYNLTLDELSPADSLDLIRHEATGRGANELAAAPDDLIDQIYRVVGGNPLALKLVVGQSHTLPLSEVLKNLRLAQGQSIQDLYRHLYWHSWRLLSESTRQVLITMPLVTEQGGEMAQIAAASELSEETVSVALAELVNTSLVNRIGGIQGSRFAIHQLTETFLVHEVFEWSSEAQT